ncbi:UBN2_3 domain-containing protein [Cephalotus follicularis]|uniref:UBN2_3 domain-containing protein n=1 Tax=Cephalotus follicularis TaxID=3775 RepID=A0A1Q3AS30_CEPFO|nr:UBN2_3 domain-containing protein [Cephalotus follicularis]
MTSESESSVAELTPNPSNHQSVTPLENNLLTITGHKFNGSNYHQWSHSVMIFICGKDKEDYITRTTVPPEESSARYRTWKAENHMVVSWLSNSMTIEMGENFMYYQIAKEIWDATRETYSNKDNTSSIFEIKGILHDLSQGEMTITDYFNALTRYWQQLDMLEDIKWHCPEDTQQYNKILEKERIYKFLLGLNKELDEVRGRILSIKPLPSVREVFSVVRREESRRKVMLGLGTTILTSTESSALAANRGQNFSNIQ